MKKPAKILTCIILSITMLIPSISIYAQSGNNDSVDVCNTDTVDQAINEVLYDDTTKTDCNGDCDYTPLIVVPGIMQSQVYLQDDNGNDLLTSDGFPIVEGMDINFMFDTNSLEEQLPSLAAPFAEAVAKNDRDIFVDKVVDLFSDSFSAHYFNPDGTRTTNVSVDEYWYSLEEAKSKPEKSYGYAKGYQKDENGKTLPTTKYKTEYDFIKSQVDMTSYCEKAGYDHCYYYAYSSFGDTLNTAERLNEYVQMVKKQTGHDKVSIVFISLGGTIGNTYLSKYCNPNDIDRAIYAASAANGSYLLSDLMDASFSFDNNELFYSEMIPELLKLTGSNDTVWLGYLANFVTRAIPYEFFSDLVNYTVGRMVKEVLDNLMVNCPSMWSTVPSEKYDELSKKYISDESHATLKAETDEYYSIQSEIKSTVQKLTKNGMDIFVICGYNLSLPTAVNSYHYSSDNIIQTSSSSIGATVADYDSVLPEDYTPSVDNSYISPDRKIDAGTCALPDRTWFVKNQSHLKLQASVKDVIELCVQITINKNITDSRVNNGGYPQFNEYRDSRALKNMMDTYNKLSDEIAQADLTDKQISNLTSSYANAESVYNKLVWSYDETKAAEEQLYKAMYNANLLGDKKAENSPFVKYHLSNILNKIFKYLSDVMLKYFGARDYYSF